MMNQLIYDKIQTNLAEFEKVKKEYGTQSLQDSQQHVVTFNQNVDALLQDIKIASSNIKNLKNQLIRFYHSDVQGSHS